ncbi:MAG: periplasmic heavy metal sensor, partial [Planctomycetes bacterium]|nr:periplasmic heavy metal sensor [Planctomycetota bacterium]
AFLLIVLSVAFNIGVAGVWAAQTVAGHWPAWEGCGPNNGSGAVWCPLHRKLNVTEEQWQRLEPRLAQFRQASQAVCQETQRKRAELIDLVAAAGTDRTAIAARQEEILAGQRRMQGLVIEQLLAEKEVLTVEQQRELFDMIRRHSGCVGPALMRGGLGEPSQTFFQGGPGAAPAR